MPHSKWSGEVRDTLGDGKLHWSTSAVSDVRMVLEEFQTWHCTTHHGGFSDVGGTELTRAGRETGRGSDCFS